MKYGHNSVLFFIMIFLLLIPQNLASAFDKPGLNNSDYDTLVNKWMPLDIGNKWYYDVSFYEFKYKTVWEVTGHVQIKNKSYAEVTVTTYSDPDSVLGTIRNYFRPDLTTGQIYTGYILDDTVYETGLYFDLSLQVGDTSNTERKVLLKSENTLSIFDISSSEKVFQHIYPVREIKIARDIGIYYEFDASAGVKISTLKGAFINGISYGDTTLVGVEVEQSPPNKFSLSQNYPNPFNPVTKIKYSVPAGTLQAGFVKLIVFDILGNEIATLVNEEKPAGEYEVEFNAANLTSGIYFYTLNTGNFRETRKMVLLR